MRSRTHILEEESFFELKKILPIEWVIREKPKDYGIDVEVEIFSSDGNSTGLVFWIQLKGTDSSNETDHKHIRLSINKIKQLHSYDLPVALFRYNSKNKEFYYDWISRCSYLSASTQGKSFSIKFEPHHLWNKDSVIHILTYLRKRNIFNQGKFNFPITGFVNNVNAPNKSARTLSLTIAKQTSLIDIVRDRYSSDIEINLLENRIVLNFMGVYGSSIGFSIKNNSDDSLLFDAFNKAFLLVLNQTNKEEEFFEFINQNNLKKEIIEHSGMLEYLLPKLLTSNSGKHFTEEIIDYVFKSGDPFTQIKIQAIIFLASKRLISKERIESYFKQVIELSLANGEKKALATIYYNYANYNRSNSNYAKALKYYTKALKLESSYLQRPYFCKEVAGVLFELNFFRFSAKFYTTAKTIDPNDIYVIALLGDAEMYSGNYEKALQLFDDFLKRNIETNHDKSEFSLKFTMLNAIVSELGIKHQNRNLKEFAELYNKYTVEQFNNSDSLDKLLEIDVLNAYVWSHYSIISVEEKDLNMIFLSTLIQAILVLHEPKIWAYLAIVTTYDEHLSRLLIDVVNAGFFYCKERFLIALQEMVEMDGLKEFRGNDFVDYVDSIIKDPKEYPMEMRFWVDGKTKILEF